MQALFLLSLLGAAVAVPRNPQRIVGGTPTTVENYPYMSNMLFNRGTYFSHSCGGSLINNYSVLSAVHCYEVRDLVSDWRVLLGTSLTNSGGTTHLVSQLILHEQYDNYDNDVAIVRLASPATFSASVGVVAIPGPNYNLADGTQLTVIGWGTLESGGDNPDQLQHVDLDIINQQLCAERYADLKTQPGYEGWGDVTDNMLCAGILDVGGKDACQGDSGGPLVHKGGSGDVIVGIVSWGYGCADPFYPGVNARVNRYTDWITSNAPDGTFPDQLQHVDLDIINQQLCAERYAYLKTQPGFEDWADVSDNMMCVGILDVGGKDACQGDSGGPLVHKGGSGDVLVGIVSWGYSCADPVYPGVNTRVNRYNDWILANV